MLSVTAAARWGQRALPWLALALQFAAYGAAPEVPADWKLELVAEAPAIRHPSVVCASPDGKVFVAEDPMDISTPRADAQEGRIICFHPDGRRTVFAEKLHAVFGMQYLEGKLYVLHNPFFSVFTEEDGAGKNRTELIESMNPNPWALDWNDHVPANFQLAMDGYFYVAVGDKGVYGAVGKDGKRVDLHGGGILRLKPDGTALEVYSTGIRNILDVALTTEDDIFTYDNTDEHDWMGRLTQMVDGGFYGYPHDFIPRRPYTLWMMHDFGGGAACGTLAYTEDALPEEYHDNLFLSDFGKRQVLRVKIKREGAAFSVAEHSEFFRNPPDDFRPVGIGWSHDGKAFYLCDWQHRDTKEKVTVGRLWKASYTGKTRETPKPEWFVPLAMGRKSEPRTEDLIKALKHPSKQVRLAAQRALVKKGGVEATAALLSLLAQDPSAPESQWHAIWALHQLDGGKTARKEILNLAADGQPSVRRQAIRQLGEAGAKEALEVLEQTLKDSDHSIRFASATALGRIGEPGSVAQLIAALGETNLFPRYALFNALNRIGKAIPQNWSEMVAVLHHQETLIREGVSFAFRETYDLELFRRLARFALNRENNLEGRKLALATLTKGIYAPAPWKGEWWAYHPALSPAPGKKETWHGTELVHDLFSKLIDDPNDAIRLLVAQGIAKSQDRSFISKLLLPAATREQNSEAKAAMIATLGKNKIAAFGTELAAILQSTNTLDEVYFEAVKAAAEIGGEQMENTLGGLLGDNNLPSERKIAVISALESKTMTSLAPRLKPLVYDSNKSLRTAALKAYGKLGGLEAVRLLSEILVSGSLEIKKEAAIALGFSGNKEGVPALIFAVQTDYLRQSATESLFQLKDLRALDVYLEVLRSNDANLRRQARETLSNLGESAKPILEGKKEKLSKEVLTELRTAWANKPELLKSSIFAEADPAPSAFDFARFAERTIGDPVAGQRIYFDEAGQSCIRCHVVAGIGSSVGPDLTVIGLQFPRKDLIEHLLEPSKIVREGYAQWNIELRNDETIGGIIRSENNEQLVIIGNDGKAQTISKSEIVSRKQSALSLMPEGLQAGLSLQGFADLIAYLESRKTDPRQPSAQAAPGEFTALLAEGELKNWVEIPAGTKRVDEAVLNKGVKPTHWKMIGNVLEHDGMEGDLWTRQSFKDFVLKLEWRWPDAPKWEEFPLISTNSYEITNAAGKSITMRVLDAGDSGVLLRGLYKAQANLFCYPVGSGESWEYRTDMSLPENVRQGVTPKLAADLPIGDWNQMEITVKGNRLTVVLNGKEVMKDAELPGLPAEGPIGLQHEHGRIQFRNVFVKAGK